LFVSDDGKKIVEIGSGVTLETDRTSIQPLPGTRVIWPVRPSGEEGNWQIDPNRLKQIYSKGYVRLGKFTQNSMALTYLKSGEQKKVEDGTFEIIGHREDGSVIEGEMTSEREYIPGSQWDIPSHNATYQGSQLLNKVLGTNRFTFPKSLYAVHDAIRFFVADKPNALIVDFFAGSGTTLHAVNLLERRGWRSSALHYGNEQRGVR
jgi:adenine-specific DNA-methyltransferase